MPRELHMPEVVVAVTAQRLPHRFVVAVVSLTAPQWLPVRTAGETTDLLVPPTHPYTLATGRTAVDGTETPRGQCHEHLRPRRDAGGHVMVSARASGMHKLPGVPRIQV